MRSVTSRGPLAGAAWAVVLALLIAVPAAAQEPVAEGIVINTDRLKIREAPKRAARLMGEIFEGDYAALTETMTSEGLIGRGWSYDTSTFVDRAAVGHMVARACDIRRGLNWQVTGLGRYAYRELIYLGIAHPGGEYSLISGGEFLGLLARAEEYLHKVGRSPGEAAQLGDEPTAP